MTVAPVLLRCCDLSPRIPDLPAASGLRCACSPDGFSFPAFTAASTRRKQAETCFHLDRSKPRASVMSDQVRMSCRAHAISPCRARTIAFTVYRGSGPAIINSSSASKFHLPSRPCAHLILYCHHSKKMARFAPTFSLCPGVRGWGQVIASFSDLAHHVVSFSLDYR